MREAKRGRTSSGRRESLSEQMRRTMRQWASGVVVVSSLYKGEKSGMTVSAFVSATIYPPTVLVCLSKSASTLKLIRLSRRLAISILSEKQTDVSHMFAGVHPRVIGNDRFRGLRTFTEKTGAPILRGSVGWLDCRVSRLVRLSSHYIIVCRVLAAGENPRAGKPLLYHDREYRKIST